MVTRVVSYEAILTKPGFFLGSLAKQNLKLQSEMMDTATAVINFFVNLVFLIRVCVHSNKRRCLLHKMD